MPLAKVLLLLCCVRGLGEQVPREDVGGLGRRVKKMEAAHLGVRNLAQTV